MARSCKQLLDSPRALFADAPDTLEIVWIESILQFPTTDGTEGDVARMCCALVSLVNDEVSLEGFARLASSLNGVRVRHQRFSGSGRIDEFGAALRDRSDDFADVVVALGDAPTDVADAHRVLEAVRSRDRDVTGIVVAVSSHPEALRDLPGFDGYFVAPERKVASIAARLLVAFGSMTAPLLFSCVDTEDIRPVIGSAAKPGRLVEALWLDERQLLAFATREDETLVAESPGCAAFIYSARTTGIAAVKALRLHAPDTYWAGFQVPIGYFVETSMSDVVTPITLLCADFLSP